MSSVPKIDDYEPIVGKNVINELRHLAEKLKGIRVQNINSTAVGGGVAEILNRMVPLWIGLGVDAHWGVIRGGEMFFVFTKKLHNALHGKPEEFTQEDYDVFEETQEANLSVVDPDAGVIYIHDPQPIGLIREKPKRPGTKWIWRCHIDFSSPMPQAWDFLKGYIEQYDAAVFSAPAFSRPLSIRQVLIAPSIDPLSDKNKDLPQEVIDQTLVRFGIDRDRPIVTQISRFDYLKDPTGVIDVFHLVKRYIDCQLVLAGGGADDDPEGMKILAEVQERAREDKDIHVLFLPPGADIEINALQRASSVVLQKSLKEGFGLTVTEALWKKKPVVASAVGGIPLQIAHRYSGLLSYSIEGTAYWVRQILNDPEYGVRLGQNGHEHVLQNFLTTRHLRDDMLLFLSTLHPGDVVHL